MTLRLIAIASDADAELLVRTLAESFGGDDRVPRELVTQTLALLTAHPRPDPWGSYIAYDRETAVGMCAFKHGPDSRGEVEIAYITFPPFEGRGHATAMIRGLTMIARHGGAAPIAHTLPLENASNRALRRQGFTFAGEVMDPEDGLVWRWEQP